MTLTSQKLDDTDSKYYSNRSRCYKELENYAKVVKCHIQAVEDAQKAVELDIKNIKAHLILGECLCMIAKDTLDVRKIDTALTRMSKCSLYSG